MFQTADAIIFTRYSTALLSVLFYLAQTQSLIESLI